MRRSPRKKVRDDATSKKAAPNTSIPEINDSIFKVPPLRSRRRNRQRFASSFKLAEESTNTRQPRKRAREKDNDTLPSSTDSNEDSREAPAVFRRRRSRTKKISVSAFEVAVFGKKQKLRDTPSPISSPSSDESMKIDYSTRNKHLRNRRAKQDKNVEAFQEVFQTDELASEVKEGGTEEAENRQSLSVLEQIQQDWNAEPSEPDNHEEASLSGNVSNLIRKSSSILDRDFERHELQEEPRKSTTQSKRASKNAESILRDYTSVHHSISFEFSKSKADVTEKSLGTSLGISRVKTPFNRRGKLREPDLSLISSDHSSQVLSSDASVKEALFQDHETLEGNDVTLQPDLTEKLKEATLLDSDSSDDNNVRMPIRRFNRDRNEDNVAEFEKVFAEIDLENAGATSISSRGMRFPDSGRESDHTIAATVNHILSTSLRSGDGRSPEDRKSALQSKKSNSVPQGSDTPSQSRKSNRLDSQSRKSSPVLQGRKSDGAVSLSRQSDDAGLQSRLFDDAMSESRKSDIAMSLSRQSDDSVLQNRKSYNPRSHSIQSNFAGSQGRKSDNTMSKSRRSDDARSHSTQSDVAVSQSRKSDNSRSHSKQSDVTVSQSRKSDNAMTQSRQSDGPRSPSKQSHDAISQSRKSDTAMPQGRQSVDAVVQNRKSYNNRSHSMQSNVSVSQSRKSDNVIPQSRYSDDDRLQSRKSDNTTSQSRHSDDIRSQSRKSINSRLHSRQSDVAFSQSRKSDDARSQSRQSDGARSQNRQSDDDRSRSSQSDEDVSQNRNSDGVVSQFISDGADLRSRKSDVTIPQRRKSKLPRRETTYRESLNTESDGETAQSAKFDGAVRRGEESKEATFLSVEYPKSPSKKNNPSLREDSHFDMSNRTSNKKRYSRGEDQYGIDVAENVNVSERNANKTSSYTSPSSSYWRPKDSSEESKSINRRSSQKTINDISINAIGVAAEEESDNEMDTNEAFTKVREFDPVGVGRDGLNRQRLSIFSENFVNKKQEEAYKDLEFSNKSIRHSMRKITPNKSSKRTSRRGEDVSMHDTRTFHETQAIDRQSPLQLSYRQENLSEIDKSRKNRTPRHSESVNSTSERINDKIRGSKRPEIFHEQNEEEDESENFSIGNRDVREGNGTKETRVDLYSSSKQSRRDSKSTGNIESEEKDSNETRNTGLRNASEISEKRMQEEMLDEDSTFSNRKTASSKRFNRTSEMGEDVNRKVTNALPETEGTRKKSFRKESFKKGSFRPSPSVSEESLMREGFRRSPRKISHKQSPTQVGISGVRRTSLHSSSWRTSDKTVDLERGRSRRSETSNERNEGETSKELNMSKRKVVADDRSREVLAEFYSDFSDNEEPRETEHLDETRSKTLAQRSERRETNSVFADSTIERAPVNQVNSFNALAEKTGHASRHNATNYTQNKSSYEEEAQASSNHLVRKDESSDRVSVDTKQSSKYIGSTNEALAGVSETEKTNSEDKNTEVNKRKDISHSRHVSDFNREQDIQKDKGSTSGAMARYDTDEITDSRKAKKSTQRQSQDKREKNAPEYEHKSHSGESDEGTSTETGILLPSRLQLASTPHVGKASTFLPPPENVSLIEDTTRFNRHQASFITSRINRSGWGQKINTLPERETDHSEEQVLPASRLTYERTDIQDRNRASITGAGDDRDGEGGREMTLSETSISSTLKTKKRKVLYMKKSVKKTSPIETLRKALNAESNRNSKDKTLTSNETSMSKGASRKEKSQSTLNDHFKSVDENRQRPTTSKAKPKSTLTDNESEEFSNVELELTSTQVVSAKEVGEKASSSKSTGIKNKYVVPDSPESRIAHSPSFAKGASKLNFKEKLNRSRFENASRGEPKRKSSEAAFPNTQLAAQNKITSFLVNTRDSQSNATRNDYESPKASTSGVSSSKIRTSKKNTMNPNNFTQRDMASGEGNILNIASSSKKSKKLKLRLAVTKPPGVNTGKGLAKRLLKPKTKPKSILNAKWVRNVLMQNLYQTVSPDLLEVAMEYSDKCIKAFAEEMERNASKDGRDSISREDGLDVLVRRGMVSSQAELCDLIESNLPFEYQCRMLDFAVEESVGERIERGVQSRSGT